MLNAQSVRNTTLLINEYVREDAIDLLAIMETWLKRDSDSSLTTELTREIHTHANYFHHNDSSIWNCCARLKRNNVRPFDVYILYHPPTSGTTSCVLDELDTLFTDIALSIIPSLIVGDFNIHYDVHSKADKLVNMLEIFDLIQHVNEPTPTHGHILTIILLTCNKQTIDSVHVCPCT